MIINSANLDLSISCAYGGLAYDGEDIISHIAFYISGIRCGRFEEPCYYTRSLVEYLRESAETDRCEAPDEWSEFPDKYLLRVCRNSSNMSGKSRSKFRDLYKCKVDLFRGWSEMFDGCYGAMVRFSDHDRIIATDGTRVTSAKMNKGEYRAMIYDVVQWFVLTGKAMRDCAQ